MAIENILNIEQFDGWPWSTLVKKITIYILKTEKDEFRCQ